MNTPFGPGLFEGFGLDGVQQAQQQAQPVLAFGGGQPGAGVG